MRTDYKIDPKLKFENLHEVVSSPVVVRVTKFDEESLEEFQKSFNAAVNTGQEIIPIEIDSFGGAVHSLMGMVAIIEDSPVPVATICMTKGMSCGAILFAFGTEGYRFLHPSASLMIHDAAWGTGGKVEDMKVDTNYVDKLNQSMYKRLAKHLGHPKNFIIDLIKQKNHLDWFLTAKEAKKLGIANELRIPKWNVSINLTVEFK